jgi:hypothetical protein
MKRLNFKNTILAVDYLTFNSQGIVKLELVETIGKYLFTDFGFNSFALSGFGGRESKKQLFSEIKNKYHVEFVLHQYNPQLDSFWEGIQIMFSGKNAARFYRLIQHLSKLIAISFSFSRISLV